MNRVVLSMFLLVGCSAAQPAPLHVRARDLSALPSVPEGRPVIVEFDAGDVIPLEISVDGELVASPKDTPAVPLIAKRHFFLRIGTDGLHTSLDGVNFGEKPKRPGQFKVGVSVTPAGVRSRIDILTPRKID